MEFKMLRYGKGQQMAGRKLPKAPTQGARHRPVCRALGTKYVYLNFQRTNGGSQFNLGKTLLVCDMQQGSAEHWLL